MGGTFTVGQLYSREQVAEVVDLPQSRRKGGSWTTGYDEWNGSTYVFTNIGTAGRTGHDYRNRWEGKQLIWYGKTNAARGQPQINRMISNERPVHVFWRGQDREPFTYAGTAMASAASDDRPIEVVWTFGDAFPGLPVDVGVNNVPVWRRGPPPTLRSSISIKTDGPTDVYLLRLAGPVDAIFDVPEGCAVVKVGMSNDVARRLDELNAGFPPGSKIGWRLLHKRTLPSGTLAWKLEGERLDRLGLAGYRIGGEYAFLPVSMIDGFLD